MEKTKLEHSSKEECLKKNGVPLKLYQQYGDKTSQVCAKDLQIEIFESRWTDDGVKQTPTKTVDEQEFMKLYGEQDLRMLLERGEEGDAIGQGRWYHAKLLNKQHEF